MHLILSLGRDDNSRLKYIVDKIFVESKSIEEFCKIYKDTLIIYQGKVYLNGEVISENYKLKDEYPYIMIHSNFCYKVTNYPGLEHHDSYCEAMDNGEYNHCFCICSNVYYIREIDVINITNFDINDILAVQQELIKSC